MAKKVAPKASGGKASVKKATPKGGAARKKTAGRAKTVAPGVTIRMYCQGLGDCFLITFRGKSNGKAQVSRVMIDCGVFLNTAGEPARMRAVAQDILKETGGKIDLLIVTHEHWDHIAGFSHANDIFEKSFTFGEVWLSWAEDPEDPDARAVKGELGKRKAKLQAALGVALKNPGLAASERFRDDLESAASVLGFLGPETPMARKPGPGVAAAAPAVPAGQDGKARMDLGTTMDWLRQKVRARDFCDPGERRPVPGADGVNAYILGPPRGVSQLRKMNPTGDQGYGLMAADQLSFFRAVDSLLEGDNPDAEEISRPFEPKYVLAEDEAKDDPFFRRRYGFPDDPLSDPVGEWRRIDHEWLVGGLSRLALQLDVGVNNTSLALAFELPDGRTLIFPGDAQIGNWLSWADLSFKVKDRDGRESTVTAKDLLNRAIFYKVGHHGSHNATLRAGGLEEMTSGDLVAMIPTDQDYASTKRPPKTGWEMPAHGVNDALVGFTKGRIIRADHNGTGDIAKDIDAGVRASRGWTEFLKRVEFNGKFPADAQRPDRPLYVEYTIPLDGSSTK